jgi:hypothetical protein
MAKNDTLLLDGIIDDRIEAHLPSDKRDEAFEFLAFEQITKDYDLSSDETLTGAIDGRADGGIDGFYIFVNGHLLQDPESFMWPRTSSELKVQLVTCKHHDTFRKATLDALIATITELFDFAVEDDDLSGTYSENLLRMRSNLKFAYRKLSPHLASFGVGVFYASRGDTKDIGEEVASRGKQIVNLVDDYFGDSTADFAFLGATELVALHRKIPNYTLELPFVEALSKGERYIVLARISDYFKFISDESRLRRYLFDSNVRDFMGMNRVNEDIKDTLENTESPDFWWLNNGVTILATSAAITGKSIQIADIQIVNGLQTSESIYRHFSGIDPVNDDRCVLVKVIVSNDENVRDGIIRATNNQTDVELASLHATDKIQRDIEDVLLRHGLFYERRKKFYANQGHTPDELVTPLYIAAGYVALVMKSPHRAALLRSKFMRSQGSYETVFNEKTPITVWPKIAHILKRVDAELEILRPQAKMTDRFLKGWRYIVALLLVANSFGKFNYSRRELESFDLALITTDAVEAIWKELSNNADNHPTKRGWTGFRSVKSVCQSFSEKHGITGIEVLTSQGPHLSPNKGPGHFKKSITDEFIEKIRVTLPPQPWKPGMHIEIAAQIKCETWQVRAAVERLIDEGILLSQKDGVLYDTDGNVVSFDAERVDPETLELIPN